jgi:hypothetical protein
MILSAISSYFPALAIAVPFLYGCPWRAAVCR